jgi:hypothetical protein
MANAHDARLAFDLDAQLAAVARSGAQQIVVRWHAASSLREPGFRADVEFLARCGFRHASRRRMGIARASRGGSI